MATQPWLDEVQRRLVKNGLPPMYIRRFMDELADHFEDLMEEKMSKETNSLSQLGEPSQVADAAVIAYRQRTFFGRHPVAKFFVFGVSPLFSMLLVFVLTCLGLFAFGSICEHFGVRLTDKTYLGGVDSWIVSWTLSLITTILPAALLTILYCRLAKRSELKKRWMLASCIMLSIFAMPLFQSITFSDIPGQNQWSVGLGLSLTPTLLQWVQMLVPLAVGLWFMRRTRSQPTDEEEPLRAAA